MAKKTPKVSVLERRLENPFGSPSIDIQLKEGKWALRVINANVRSGRVWDVIHNKGWEFVTVDELPAKPEELGFRELDGRVVRGEKAEEVLVKMPLAMFQKIQNAKAAANLKSLGKKQTVEGAAQMAAAQGLGDEAAETIYRSNIQVNDSRVSIDLEGENAS